MSIDKQKVKEVMLRLESKFVEKANINYSEFLEDNQLDGEIAESVDDHSHIVENEEIAHTLERQIFIHQQHIAQLESIDFSSKTHVDLGAVIKINGKYFVVAVAEPKFDFEGKAFIGISVEAPFYAAMRGLKVGSTFTFNNTVFTIEAIY
jgi:phage terminase small subunit